MQNGTDSRGILQTQNYQQTMFTNNIANFGKLNVLLELLKES